MSNVFKCADDCGYMIYVPYLPYMRTYSLSGHLKFVPCSHGLHKDVPRTANLAMDLVDQGKLLSLAEEHHAAWVPWQETKWHKKLMINSSDSTLTFVNSDLLHPVAYPPGN